MGLFKRDKNSTTATHNFIFKRCDDDLLKKQRDIS